jgi:AcrR family transcriptional regulator
MGENQYHHGDLKKEMIRKGIQLLHKEGYEDFSLRKVAAACNVSHAAPYRHFRSKEELFHAINLEISVSLKEALQKGLERYRDDPGTRMVEMCKHYITFMVENPDYFRYIFMTGHDRQIVVTDHDIMLEDEEHPFSIGRKYAKDYFSRFHNDESGWVMDFIALWSQIQGLTLMLVNGTLGFQENYVEFAGRIIRKQFDSFEHR